MLRWFAALILTSGAFPMASQAQYVPLKGPAPGPAHATIFGAGAEYLRLEFGVRYPKVVLVVSPNTLPPYGSQLPRFNQYGETFGPRHPAEQLAGLERKGAIVVASHAQALDCDGKQGGKCLRTRVYLAAAFTEPVVKGDSAVVGALTFLAVAPDSTSPVGTPERLGSMGGSDLLLQLVKKAGKWQVVGHKVLMRR